MALKRTRRKPSVDVAEVPMTPMIDVVFQLLIYFIFTMKPVDVVTHLDVFRPSAESAPKEKTETPKLIQIMITEVGVSINNKQVPLAELDRLLNKLASFDRSQTIMIQCTPRSPHRDLVRVLDLCSKSGLNNLSVLSMN